MNCSRRLTDTLYWVGANDRRIALFENVYPVPRGVSYNSYLLLDEKTALFDTIDQALPTSSWKMFPLCWMDALWTT